MAHSRPHSHRNSFFAPVSIDLLIKVLNITLLHPFVCWLVPLCLRARVFMWDEPTMLFAFAWAILVSVGWLAGMLNRRIAFGPPREVDLDEEVIVITGGAGGVGGLLAEVYGMRGATVAVLDVKELENGEARGVTCYKCDVGDREQVAKAAEQIERDLGTPTVLVNNAAIVPGKSLLNLSMDDLDKSLRTNLHAPFYSIKTFLPGMIRAGRGGTIVNVSSVLGHLGAAQLTDYAASKAGLTAMHKSLTAELRSSHPDIRTVLVTPGQLTTPLFLGVRTPSSFLAPLVEPVDVVKEIVAAIDSGTGGILAMPFYARWADWYNVLPASIQVLARWVAGVDKGMATFQGREGLGNGEGSEHVKI